jgi:hypothetical protein
MINYNNTLFEQDFLTTFTILIAIIYVSILYIILGLFITYNLDRFIFHTSNKEFSIDYVNSTPTYILILNIIFTFCTISLIAYLTRNIVQVIPFPFNFANIDYKSVREVYTGSILAIILIAFSQTLSTQYKEIKYKLNGKVF